MANNLIYEDLEIGNEATWGASVAATTYRLAVKSVTFNRALEKQLAETTTVTPKGRDRIVSIKSAYEGDITGIVTPRVIHHMLELVNGEFAVAGSSAGTSATIFEYPQNTSGSMASKFINLDRNNSTERFLGVRGKSLEITFSDSVMEFTLNGMAKTRGLGTALANNLTGETIKPFVFADATVSIHQGASYSSTPVTLAVSEFSLTYDNGLESTYLSGSADPSRSDPKMPDIKGKFKIFHDGASWTDAAYGASEFYIRMQATLPSSGGLIAGVTPFILRIDVPRTELTTNVRNYEQAELSVEEIEFSGMVEKGLSLLWRVQLTAGASVS